MRWISLIVVSMAVLAASCSNRLPATVTRQTEPARAKGLVGKWLTPTGGSIEFRPGGVAVMTGPMGGAAQASYKQLDERSIDITLPGGTTTIRWQVISVGERELVIKDVDGLELTLRRTE